MEHLANIAVKVSTDSNNTPSKTEHTASLNPIHKSEHSKCQPSDNLVGHKLESIPTNNFLVGSGTKMEIYQSGYNPQLTPHLQLPQYANLPTYGTQDLLTQHQLQNFGISPTQTSIQNSSTTLYSTPNHMHEVQESNKSKGPIHITFESLLLQKYWRNDRRNLQCFPFCPKFGDYKHHKQYVTDNDTAKSYCNQPFDVSIQFDDPGLALNSSLRVFGRFRELSPLSSKTLPEQEEDKDKKSMFTSVKESIPLYHVGDVLEEDERVNQKDARFRYRAQFYKMTNNCATFRFSPGHWKYTSKLPKTRVAIMNTRHCFEIIIAIENTMPGNVKKELRLIAVQQSPAFKIANTRSLLRNANNIKRKQSQELRNAHDPSTAQNNIPNFINGQNSNTFAKRIKYDDVYSQSPMQAPLQAINYPVPTNVVTAKQINQLHHMQALQHALHQQQMLQHHVLSNSLIQPKTNQNPFQYGQKSVANHQGGISPNMSVHDQEQSMKYQYVLAMNKLQQQSSDHLGAAVISPEQQHLLQRNHNVSYSSGQNTLVDSSKSSRGSTTPLLQHSTTIPLTSVAMAHTTKLPHFAQSGNPISQSASLVLSKDLETSVSVPNSKSTTTLGEIGTSSSA